MHLVFPHTGPSQVGSANAWGRLQTKSRWAQAQSLHLWELSVCLCHSLLQAELISVAMYLSSRVFGIFIIVVDLESKNISIKKSNTVIRSLACICNSAVHQAPAGIPGNFLSWNVLHLFTEFQKMFENAIFPYMQAHSLLLYRGVDIVEIFFFISHSFKISIIGNCYK